MKKLIAVIASVWILCLSPISAQTNLPPTLSTAGSDRLSTDQPAQQAAPESKLVETWLNMSGHFNDRLLATVYWSLGAIGGVLVALTGFSWFLNFRVYERDKAAMMTEILDAQRTAFRELETTVSDKSATIIQNSFDQIRNYIKLQHTQIKDETKKSLALLASKVRENRQSIYGIYVENEMKEADHWTGNRVFENTANCYIRAIEYAIGCPSHEWRIADALKGIGDLLESGKLRRGDWETDFMRIVPTIPAVYQSLKERALTLLSKT